MVEGTCLSTSSPAFGARCFFQTEGLTHVRPGQCLIIVIALTDVGRLSMAYVPAAYIPFGEISALVFCASSS
jgi:hypothetical protein